MARIPLLANKFIGFSPTALSGQLPRPRLITTPKGGGGGRPAVTSIPTCFSRMTRAAV
jgi:hypothetical protein